MTTRAAVSEVFGPTIQGEGPDAGRPAVFLRFAGCPLRCRWCDTPYSWDWSRYRREDEVRLLPAGDVARQTAELIIQAPGSLLVLTGGEPMMQQVAAMEIIEALRKTWPRQRVAVETAGVVTPRADLAKMVDRWVVSPKLPSAGNPPARSWRHEVLQHYAELGASFKLVVGLSSPGDDQPEEVLGAVEQLRALGVSGDRVWLMPECTTAAEHAARWAEVVTLAVRLGVAASPRLHVLAWGARRGV